MRVAVLGAAGTIGPAIARDLADAEEIEQLLLLDLDRERLERVAAVHGLGAERCELRAVDKTSGLGASLEGVDVLVNSASYRINLEAMRAALDAGCHYLDLGGLYWMTSRQLDLHGRFERAGLLALLGIGSSPGKTNLMASEAVRILGTEPGEIAVSAAGRDLDPPPGFSVPYALRTLLDELTMAPIVLREGRPVEIEPLARGGAVDFGEPIGEAETIHTLHSELRTFGESFGCTEASFRLSLEPDLVSRLRELVDVPEAEIRRAEAQAQPPSPTTVAVHVVEVSGDGRGVRMRAVTEPSESWGIGGGILSTAAPAAAAVRLIARGEVPGRGALPPERCLDPRAVFTQLERRGCRFETEIREGVSA